MSDKEAAKPLLRSRERCVLLTASCVYFFCKFATLPLIQQYVYFLALRERNLTTTSYKAIETYIYDVEVNKTLLSQNTTNLESADTSYADSLSLVEEINKEASTVVLWLTFAEFLPTVIIIAVYGFASDVIGKRKFMMWLPCFGNSLLVLGFMLPEYFAIARLDSSITMACFYIACIISGLSGSNAGFYSANACYISDIDSPAKRSEKLAILELGFAITSGSAALLNEIWISYSDHFEVPMWIIFSLSFITGLGIICFLPEPYPKFDQIHESFFSKVTQALSQGNKIYAVLKLKLETKLIFISYIIFVFVQYAQERTYVLFLLNHPLSWTPTQLGLFLFTIYVVAGVGCWPGYWVLSKWLSDVDVFILSLVSISLGTVVMIVTQNIIAIYCSAMIKLFHLLPYSVAKSLISQQVDKDLQGSINGIVHSVHALVSFLGPVIIMWIFTETLNLFNGTSFIVSAILIIPAICLLYFVKYHDNKLKGYCDIESEVHDTQLKEKDDKKGISNSVTEINK